MFAKLKTAKPVDKKQQEEKKSTAQKKSMIKKATAQGFMNFEGVTRDGVLVNGKSYSKIYELIDSNFQTEPYEKQLKILTDWITLMNGFSEDFDITLIIMNERNTKADLSDNYHIKLQGNEKDEFIADYNGMIDKKIAVSHTEIHKRKFLMLTYNDKNKEEKTADKNNKNKADDELQKAIVEINLAESQLQENAKRINKKGGVIPLGGYERVEFMHKIMNGITNEVPFKKEYEKCFDIQGDECFLNANKMKKQGITVKDMVAPQVIDMKNIGFICLGENRYAKTVTMHHLPETLDTKFLTDITDFAYEMITVIQFRPSPRKKSESLVKMALVNQKAEMMKQTKKVLQEGYGSTEFVNEDVKLQYEASAKLRNDVVVDGKKLFFATITSTFFCQSEDELKNVSKLFTAKCTNHSVSPQFYYGQQKDCLNTALCVGNSKIIGDRLLTSDNVASLFPFSVQELTDKKGHFYGVNAVSGNMIMYDRKRSKLANGLEFGISGSGKSFFIKGEIICNLLDGSDDMIILDPENEYRIVAEHFGGTVIDLALKSKWHINPCDLTMEWGDDDEEDLSTDPIAEKCDYMVGLVESIYGKGRDCNIYETNAIHRATKRMYAEYVKEMTYRHENGCSEGQSDILDVDICPTLFDFYKELKADGTAEATKVASAIETYCVPDGSYSIFSHKTNVPKDNRITVYNLLYLPEKMMEMAMKVCLADIWAKIVRNREMNDKYKLGKSIWVYLDEFHHFFKTQSSADTIKAYYKRVRKYGGIMTGITQDASDLLSNEAGRAMFSNTGFFVFLNQSALGREKLQDLYNISDALIDYITDKPVGTGLIYNNTVMIPFDYKIPNDTKMYGIMSTNPHDQKEKREQAKKKANDEFNELQVENDKKNQLKKNSTKSISENDDVEFIENAIRNKAEQTVTVSAPVSSQKDEEDDFDL